MSISVTETMNGHAIRAKNEEQRRAQPRGAQISPKELDVSPSRYGTDMLDAAKGLGITTPSQVWIQNRLSEANSRAPLLEIGDTNTSNYTLGKEYLQRQPLQQARDRITEPQNSSDAAENPVEVTGEGSSSAASSLRNYRSSSDSWATAVSTVPTTPGGRASITSTFSRALSRSSRFDSAPSTPSHSRSPSPPLKKSSSNQPHLEPNGAATGTSSISMHRKRCLPKRKNSSKRSNENASENERSQSSDDQSNSFRRAGRLRKKSVNSIPGLFKSSISENEAPGPSKSPRPEVPPLPMSLSSDKISSLGSPTLSPGRASPMPRLPSERVTGSGLAMPKKKDELWNVFRNLDADFAKFTSKSLAFKASVVRSSLLPFLRTYATHPSNRTLRLEDLDRRANILKKWWTGLIELLHGRNNRSISGTDRPAILDGISGIMDRPEWRSSPSQFCPLDQRHKGAPSPKNHSKTSLMSNASDFLAESVHHNVRNTFIQNLTAQMAFVVDKMSLRSASASLVTFCGKACAYAFVFVPGMADVLVRLWDLHIDTPRRILQGYGIGKFDDVSSVANAITPGFPPALHPLGFSSLAKYMRKLRTPPQLPVGTGNIQWWGHWIERWSGRESDLFYVFVKHFHILVTDFLPSDITKKERLCAPGLLLVHAQILVNLDTTIHRQANQGQQDPAAGGPSPTFDDLLADPDAIASTLPMPPTNASRLMAENRLVMLIRDFLSERAADYPVARRLFAESFGDLLETAARGCGLFDHAASYTLLDFLDETLVLLARFERLKTSRAIVINLEFWKTVWKKMISSQNTLTEIRLYSFLYTVWNTVICESGWKADVCSDFLLDPKIFESRFSHWCPTVRAYFMRLLCWRVARQDCDYSSVDVDILETLSERLRTTWSHYIYLQGSPELQGTLPPPTNPCNPVPSRRLRIVRTDGPVDPGRAFLSLDNILPSKDCSNFTPSALNRISTLSQVDIDVRPGSSRSNSDSEAEQRVRGIGGFIRNLIGNKNRSKSQTPTRSKPQLDSVSELPNGTIRFATDDVPISRPPASDSSENHVEIIQHRTFSFRFALEYHPNAKPLPPMRLNPPRLPTPAQQFLMTYSQKADNPGYIRAVEPSGESKAHAKYCGHALAEWAVILGECHSFFERRKNEGIPSNKYVETPTLGVEVFRRPG